MLFKVGNLDSLIVKVLDGVALSVEDWLTNFANHENFTEQISLGFGNSFNTEKAEELRQQWTNNDFSTFPEIEIRSSAEINGSVGAFSVDTNKIYLSQEFISENQLQSEAITQVLLEEIGHFVDSQINISDASGDEGEIFAALVLEQTLNTEQLQQLKKENDTVTIILDGQTIQIEQASVSDSGGYEGSNETLTLETKGGGVVKYSYEHYTIPDNFSIKYEDKTILETGFVGGNKSGTLKIPKGDSNQLQITVATDDEGTAWNYTVEYIPCPDTTPLLIELANGQAFEDTDGDGDCDAQGTIYIGRTDGISRMLRIEGAKAEYDEESFRLLEGTIYSEIGGVTAPLFQGTFEIPLGSASTSSLSDSGGSPNEFKLAGLDVDFTELSLNPNGINLSPSFKLPDDIGSIIIDSLSLGDKSLQISQNGIALKTNATFSIPNQEFSFFKLFDVEASDLSLQYIANGDKLKFQGKFVLDSFVKDTFIDKVTADLSGDNFIEIGIGEADIKGSLTVETDLETAKGWSLSEIKLDIDTKNKDVGGKVKVGFPFKGRIPEVDFGLGFKTPIPPLELNKIDVNVDNLNVPIPNFPLVFFQRFGGAIENFAPSDFDPIEFSGGIGFTAGPQVFGKALLRLDLDGKISSEQLSGTGTVIVIDEKIATGQTTNTLNWNKGFIENSGSFSILDGLIQTNNSFKVDSSFNINTFGQATVSVPNFIPVWGGAKIGSGNSLFEFSNDGNLANDFAAGWGTLNIQKLGFEISVVIGFKGYFDGRFERIGANNTPPTPNNFAIFEDFGVENALQTNGFVVAPGTPWILLSADWENEVTENVPVRIQASDGRIITEADFASNNIAIVDELTDSTTKVVIIFNPEPGNWGIEVVDDTGLGQVQYTTVQDSIAPSISVTAPITDVSGSEFTIAWNAFDPDSIAEISLFYDTNNQGFDGILIADGLTESDGAGSFVWNTEGVPTGEYYIYAMAMDENNPPVFSYSPGRILITQEADLSVIQTANINSVEVGKNLTYTIKVTNNGSIESESVILTETLPEEVTLVSTSITPSEQTDNVLTYNFGDLAAGESKTVDITVTAPTAPTTIAGTALVTSNTFDPNITNNADSVTTQVEIIPSQPKFPDLAVIRTDSPGLVAIGDPYSYTLTVTNNGSGDATDVVLLENLLPEINLINTSTENLVDLIKLQLNAGERVTIDIDAGEFTSQLDPILRLFNSSGNQVAVNDDGAAPGEGVSFDSYINFTAATSDTYYVGVSNFANFNYSPFVGESNNSGSSSGNYDITITVGSGGFIRQGTLSEPNNTIAQAFDSELSSTNSGTFIGSGFIGADNSVSVNNNNGVVSVDFGDLKSGESKIVNFTVSSIAAGNLITTTNVTSNETDINPLNNSIITSKLIDSVSIQPADLELTMTVDNSNAQVGDQITFTLTLTNKGPGIASGIKVTDLLPSQLSFLSASSIQGSYDPNTGIWDVGNIRDNLSRTLEITARVNQAGSFTNKAEVTGTDQLDPDSTPNNNNSNEDDLDSLSFTIFSNTGTSGNDVITGTSEDEVLTGLRGQDTITGGGGSDIFVYESFIDRGDVITDFSPDNDLIDLSQIFDNSNYGSTTPFESYVRLVQIGANTDVQINPIGDSRQIFRSLLTLENVVTNDLNTSNFII